MLLSTFCLDSLYFQSIFPILSQIFSIMKTIFVILALIFSCCGKECLWLISFTFLFIQMRRSISHLLRCTILTIFYTRTRLFLLFSTYKNIFPYFRALNWTQFIATLNACNADKVLVVLCLQLGDCMHFWHDNKLNDSRFEFRNATMVALSTRPLWDLDLT